MMKYLNYIAFALFLISCENKIERNLINQKKFVVINGFLSPQDTVLRVQVSNAISRGTSDDVLEKFLISDKKAYVSISNKEKQKVVLSYSEASEKYQINAEKLKILPGEIYSLLVETNGRQYKASCKIPVSKIEELNFELKEGSSKDKDVELKFKDIANIDNYYIVEGKIINDRGFESIISFGSKSLITDKNKDGLSISVIGETYFCPGIQSKIVLKVFNSEKCLFEGLERVSLINDNSKDILRFHSSIITPSNIEGKNGYGVFAGYQLTEIKKNLSDFDH